MLSMEETLDQYKQILNEAETKKCIPETMAYIAKNDLFFLLLVMCDIKDMRHPWLYERCREIEANPDGYIDIYAREHFKTTIITFGKSLQDIINNPNITIGIFAFKFDIASGFLKRIKNELKKGIWIQTFPDILYQNPEVEAVKDGGSWNNNAITVKRPINRIEATVEAHGFNSLPTSRHFDILVYDDVVTEEAITTQEQIRKTEETFDLSGSLGSRGGRTRIIGTRYMLDDLYGSIINKRIAIPRIYPAIDGNDKPVFFSEEELTKRKNKYSNYIYSCQYLCDPSRDSHKNFQENWLLYHVPDNNSNKRLNNYIIIDPANSKTNRSDYTAMLVLGLGSDKNWYLVDGIKDRLSLSERKEKLFDLHRKHGPLGVFYESYGMLSDVDYIKECMSKEKYTFSITKAEYKVRKEERIGRLEPFFRNGRIIIPEPGRCVRYTINRERYDLTEEFKKEYLRYPFTSHDDMLDCMANITNPNITFKAPGIIPDRWRKKKPQYAKTNYDWRQI